MKQTRERETSEYFTEPISKALLAANGYICLLILAMPAFAAQTQSSKLNVVLIISDDHGWRDSRCYGNRDTRTPNMDRLASQGMRFARAFAASTLCSPSRAVIDTGLMPFRNGGHVFGGRVRPGTPTIVHDLRDLGYQSANIGKFSKHPNKAFPYEVVKKDGPPRSITPA